MLSGFAQRKLKSRIVRTPPARSVGGPYFRAWVRASREYPLIDNWANGRQPRVVRLNRANRRAYRIARVSWMSPHLSLSGLAAEADSRVVLRRVLTAWYDEFINSKTANCVVLRVPTECVCCCRLFAVRRQRRIYVRYSLHYIYILYLYFIDCVCCRRPIIAW